MVFNPSSCIEDNHSDLFVFSIIGIILSLIKHFKILNITTQREVMDIIEKEMDMKAKPAEYQQCITFIKIKISSIQTDYAEKCKNSHQSPKLKSSVN